MPKWNESNKTTTKKDENNKKNKNLNCYFLLLYVLHMRIYMVFVYEMNIWIQLKSIRFLTFTYCVCENERIWAKAMEWKEINWIQDCNRQLIAVDRGMSFECFQTSGHASFTLLYMNLNSIVQSNWNYTAWMRNLF